MCIKADDFFLPKNRLLLRMPVLFLLGGKTLSLIKIENLTFAYGGGENLFENVSLSLDTNWRTGLIGRNGRAFMGGDAVANKLWTKKLHHHYARHRRVSFRQFHDGLRDQPARA